MDESFDEYYIPLLKDIGNNALISEWKRNVDADAYENISDEEIKLVRSKK